MLQRWIDLALKSLLLPLPPRLVFVSSPALLANSQCRVPLENYPDDYFGAAGWAFIQSIWVAQRCLALNASLQPIIIDFDQHHKAFRYGRGWLTAIARNCLCVGAVPDVSRVGGPPLLGNAVNVKSMLRTARCFMGSNQYCCEGSRRNP
ncbi:hypothetical protein EDB19DRAFT_467296 [Suillus lakei]|nr:hypothetical protein EDB19DRAFT_467296 [Suillus lakei]